MKDKLTHLCSKSKFTASESDCIGSVPDAQQYLQRMVDWCTPDSGIEEEYNPNKDQLYSWSGLRIMASMNLKHLSDKNVNVLESSVQVWKNLVPSEKGKEEEKEERKEEGGKQ
jgi:hypothetical protein